MVLGEGDHVLAEANQGTDFKVLLVAGALSM